MNIKEAKKADDLQLEGTIESLLLEAEQEKDEHEAERKTKIAKWLLELKDIRQGNEGGTEHE